MTCLDDITRGTSAFNYAIRHPHKTGPAFEIMRGRRPISRRAADLAALFALSCAALAVLGALANIGA